MLIAFTDNCTTDSPLSTIIVTQRVPSVLSAVVSDNKSVRNARLKISMFSGVETNLLQLSALLTTAAVAKCACVNLLMASSSSLFFLSKHYSR